MEGGKGFCVSPVYKNMKSSPNTELFNLAAESVAYENTVVLKNITLQIDRGEKVALVGPEWCR